jgi:uncharacterized protein
MLARILGAAIVAGSFLQAASPARAADFLVNCNHPSSLDEITVCQDPYLRAIVEAAESATMYDVEGINADGVAVWNARRDEWANRRTACGSDKVCITSWAQDLVTYAQGLQTQYPGKH